MQDIINSFFVAVNLILSLDGELYGIIALSLFVTIVSTVVASFLGVPLGLMLASNEFKGKRFLMRITHTAMGLPPVVVGLIVYLFLSRKGPLAGMQLLFTPAAMMIAQVLIITPIITGLTASSVKLKSKSIQETCTGLGLKKHTTFFMLFHECRYAVISAVLAGYGRAVSEVGAVMLVGGNIQYNTRVMTTAIVLETGKGNYDKALAMGIILLTIAFLINFALQWFQEES